MLIGVLESCAHPKVCLSQIYSLLQEKNWYDVRILIATLDPDFFCPKLPTDECTSVNTRFLGEDFAFTVVEPGAWERAFVDVGFHVLDQRPLHLELLPSALHNFEIESFRQQWASADSAKFVLPRQGPFYFWLLSPRHSSNAEDEAELSIGGQIFRRRKHNYRANEVIEVRGNLGSRIHQVTNGVAELNPKVVLPFRFESGSFFGQMEVGQNYFASRLMGNVCATQPTTADSFSLSEIAKSLSKGDFGHKLFLSMTSYWDSDVFSLYVSGASLPARSDVVKAVTRVGVRSCAAIILNACAKRHSSVSYRSRLLVELDSKGFERALYRVEKPKRRDEAEWMKALKYLVNSNVIDCFSASFLSTSNLHENINQISESDLLVNEYLNIGHIATRCIRDWLANCPDTAVHSEKMKLKPISLEVSKFLGFDLSLEEEKRRRTISLNQLIESLIEQVEKQIKISLSAPKKEILGKFLRKLRSSFFLKVNDYLFGSGFSHFMVIRDVWALIACVQDDPAIWSCDSDFESAQEPTFKKKLALRLIPYFWECVSYIGNETLRESRMGAAD